MLLLYCLLFFALSWVLAYTIHSLPVWCQSWTLTSVWGILSVGTFSMIVWPESRPYIERMALLFLAAYPGMLGLEFWQRRQRIWYWQKRGVPLSEIKRSLPSSLLSGINERLDRWAFSRVEDRLMQDQQAAIEEAERITGC